jgi:SNF2 family DNA or RNA helicase
VSLEKEINLSLKGKLTILAHYIRNMSTKLFKSVSALSAQFRWCLTGTPIQNRLDDLASLVAFIRLYPLNNSIEFKNHIIKPFAESKKVPSDSTNLRILLDSILLRRRRQVILLPNRLEVYRLVDFSPEETLLYNSVREDVVAATKATDTKDTSRNFLQAQLRLRLICNHGTHEITSNSSQSVEEVDFNAEQAFETLLNQGMANCILCSTEVTGVDDNEDEALSSGTFTSCGYLLCSGCLPQYKLSTTTGFGPGFRCHTCSRGKVIAPAEPEQGLAPMPEATKIGLSSKVSALIADIMSSNSQGKRYTLH